MRFFPVVFLLLALSTTAVQAATLHGRVFETRDGTVGSDIRVILGTSPPRETRTDSYGFYRFDDVKPGGYLVRLFVTETPVIARVVVHAGQMTLHSFNLANIGPPPADDGY